MKTGLFNWLGLYIVSAIGTRCGRKVITDFLPRGSADTAGTLIFTSIMAVTVVELIVWVALGFAVTGTSKILAFFLCLVFEETG